MKTTMIAALAALAGLQMLKGEEDLAVMFSTKGPDRYMDGTTVMDGECYALVWSKDGTFEGFSADGTAVDPDDRIVRVGAAAENGRCHALFQLDAAEAADLSTGVFAVYLLDTRVSENGVIRPKGVANGKPALLNSYAEVAAKTSIRKTAASAVMRQSAESAAGATPGKCAAPAKESRPAKIVGVKPEGDGIVLEVEGDAGYVRAQGGPDVGADATVSPAVAIPNAGGRVRIVMPKTGSSGFYRAVHSN